MSVVDTHNLVALGACFAVVGVWLKFTQVLTEKRIWSSATARKWIHIMTGPLYLVCWNLFNADPSAKYYAAVVPATLVVKFGLIGLGLWKDEVTVKSMSRSGRASELLFGPCSYGVIFVLSTIWYWGDLKGITALMLLCAGDGFAGLLGPVYGKHSLPWNKQKSWEGSIVFFLSAVLFTVLLHQWFYFWRWFTVTPADFLSTLLSTALIATLVESLPAQDQLDNITVFIISVLYMKFCGY